MTCVVSFHKCSRYSIIVHQPKWSLSSFTLSTFVYLLLLISINYNNIYYLYAILHYILKTWIQNCYRWCWKNFWLILYTLPYSFIYLLYSFTHIVSFHYSFIYLCISSCTFKYSNNKTTPILSLNITFNYSNTYCNPSILYPCFVIDVITSYTFNLSIVDCIIQHCCFKIYLNTVILHLPVGYKWSFDIVFRHRLLITLSWFYNNTIIIFFHTFHSNALLKYNYTILYWIISDYFYISIIFQYWTIFTQ